jgi:hypothetical protein
VRVLGFSYAMKLTLRDFFWLVLLAASVTAWGIEHRRGAKEMWELRLHSSFLNSDRNAKPSGDELERRAEMARLATLSDAELVEHLASLPAVKRYENRSEYESCLVEMSRRGIAEELQEHYDALMTQSAGKSGSDFPNNLELLTALRRAQGMPDPLIITIRLDGAKEPFNKFQAPTISAVIENIDVGHESVFLLQGSDRNRERWRFVLTDEQGRRVADSNFVSLAMGGGLGSIGPFQYGEKSRWNYAFDLRHYVSPPPSGKYQLQVLYHNSLGIAHERDCSGLIVVKSEPVSVVASNREVRISKKPWIEIPVPLAILAACVVMTLASSVGRFPGIRRRDFCWGVLVLAVALGMWLDDRQRLSLIRRWNQQPDAAADWSIRLADDAKL